MKLGKPVTAQCGKSMLICLLLANNDIDDFNLAWWKCGVPSDQYRHVDVIQNREKNQNTEREKPKPRKKFKNSKFEDDRNNMRSLYGSE